MGKSSAAGRMSITEYRMSLHLGVGLSVDAITEVRVDDKVAWSGDITSNGAIQINRPDLFGGQKKEGGLVGTMQVLFGRDDQILPDAVAARYGRTPDDCPAFRGLTTLMFHGSSVVSTGRPNEWDDWAASVGSSYYDTSGGFLWKTNSYVIAQKIEVTGRRSSKGLNPTYAMIGPDSNPIHIIYEALTNDDWGMNGSPDLIDVAQFNAEAVRIYNEAFGMSFWWMRSSKIETLILEVLDHIQATLFFNPRSGLLSIKLLRDDYDVGDLRVIDSNNATLSNFKQRSVGEIVNEIALSWTNPITEQAETITGQDIASIQSQGGEKVSASRNYYGIRNVDLASEVLARDLRASTAPLVSADAKLDRSAWDVLPGEVMLLSWPEWALNSIVVRAGKVNYGQPKDSAVKVSLVQDVFSLSKPPIAILPGSGWVDPRVDPQPLSMVLFSAPSFFVRNTSLQNGAVVLGEGETLVGALADSQTYDSLDYELVSDGAAADGSPIRTSKGAMTLTPKVVLTNTLPAAATSVLPVSLFPVLDEAPKIGGFIFFGSTDAGQEIALVTGRDDTGWTISRGALDTIPRTWAAGSALWVVSPGARIVDDQTIHAAGATATYRGLDRTSRGLLDYEDAPTVSTTVLDRANLPLRPADVKVNGVAFGSAAVGGATIQITWANRNRLMEDSRALLWTDGSIDPEYRQETVIRAYDATTNALVAEYAYMWTETSRSFAKSTFDRYASVRFVVSSRRDDLESLQAHSVTLTGFANNPGVPPPASDAPGQRSEPTPIWPAPGVAAFTYEAGLAAEGVSSVPALIVSGKQDDTTATHLLFQYRSITIIPGEDGEPEQVIRGDWVSSPPRVLLLEPVRFAISEDVQPDTIYEGRCAYVIEGAPSRWRVLGTVTTGSLLAEVSPESPALIEAEARSAAALAAAAERIETAQGEIATSVVIANEMLTRLRLDAERFGRLLDVGIPVSELLQKILDYNPDTGTTIIREEVVIETPSDGSLAMTLDGLRADLNGNIAALALEAVTRTSADEALGSLHSGLVATVAANRAAAESSLEVLADDLQSVSNSLTFQTSRIDDLDDDYSSISAIVSGHTATFASLPSLYASASAFADISAEMIAARNGSASLHGQLTLMRQTVTDGLDLRVTTSEYSSALARISAAENDIDDLAVANGDRLYQIGLLEAWRTVATEAIADLDEGKASLAYAEGLGASLTAQGLTISGHTTRLDSIDAALPGKASNAVVTAQGLRITAAEDEIDDLFTANGDRIYQITQLEVWRNTASTQIADLDEGKASQTSVEDLGVVLTAQGLVVSGHTTRLDDIDVALPGLASNAVVTAQGVRITVAEEDIADLYTANGDRIYQITQLEAWRTTASTSLADLALGKASQAYVEGIGAQVTTQGGVLEAIGERLDEVEVDVAGRATSSQMSAVEVRASGLEDDMYNVIQAIWGPVTGFNARFSELQSAYFDLEEGKIGVDAFEALSVQVGDLDFSLTTVSSVAYDAADRLGEVFFAKIADAGGGNPAVFSMMADSGGGSDISFAASRLLLRNVSGGVTKTALMLVDGRAVFGSEISVIYSGRRTTLGPGFGASGDLHLWSGSTSIGYGSEQVDNGILGVSSNDGWFGGQTLSGPFDSGEAAASVSLTGDWIDVAVVASKKTREGYIGFWPQASVTGSGAYNAETGRYHVAIGWRVISTDQSSGDLVEHATGSQSNSSLTNVTMPLNFAPAMNAGESVAFGRTGDRRLVLQLRRTVGVSATSTLARLRGFYSA